MRVQAFIPNWPGPKQHAGKLMDTISTYCPTTILNDPADYFNAQWMKAHGQFDADVLLWCMADVTLPEDFAGLYKSALEIMARGDVGWYAPDIAWTSYIYDKVELRPLSNSTDIYEVPNTDSLLMFMSRKLVKLMPYIDPNLSFMWGMDVAAIATARLNGLKVVRDYNFKAGHPNDTGYSIPRAGNEMAALFGSFNPQLQAAVRKVEDDVRRLRRGPCASL